MKERGDISKKRGVKGRVIGIFLRSAHGETPQAVPQAWALLHRGLEGNLYGKGPGEESRQVLLVDLGDLMLLNLKPGELREQITVDLPRLMSLPSGARLAVGEATLEITRPCTPCSHIAELVGRQDREAFRQALVGHRGVLAKVVEVSGQSRIAVGDPVQTLPSASPVPPPT